MRRLGLISAFVVSQGAVLLLLVGPLWGAAWLSGFRLYFANDQMSYAGIAVNVAHGHSPLTEPFTLTGASYYPSAWYTLLGIFSRLTHLPPWTSWQVCGLAVVSVTVALLGVLGWRMSRYWWAPALPGIALGTGCLAHFTSGYWYASLNSHAVLWGPFATFFTLNAEVIGMCACALVLAGLGWASTAYPNMTTTRTRWILLLSGVGAGAISSVQTYSFFTVTTLIAVWAAIYGITQAKSKARLTITLLLLAGVLLVGPIVGSNVSQIAVFAMLLLACLPGALWTIRKHWWAARWFGLAYALAASFQIVRTLDGLLHHDPFLLYRQASTQGLGVSIWSGLLAGSPVIVLAIATLLGLVRRGDTALASLVSAALVSWVILSQNDHWGFSQEPYRLWIEGLIQAAFLTAVVLPRALRARGRVPRSWLTPAVALAGAALVIASWADIPGFAAYASQQGVVDTQASRSLALARAADPVSAPGLLAAGACIDPRELKLVSGGQVAFENLGLAWAADHIAIEKLAAEHDAGVLTAATLRAAGVRYLLTDSACAEPHFAARDHVVPDVVVAYRTGTRSGVITRWSITPQ